MYAYLSREWSIGASCITQRIHKNKKILCSPGKVQREPGQFSDGGGSESYDIGRKRAGTSVVLGRTFLSSVQLEKNEVFSLGLLSFL